MHMKISSAKWWTIVFRGGWVKDDLIIERSDFVTMTTNSSIYIYICIYIVSLWVKRMTYKFFIWHKYCFYLLQMSYKVIHIHMVSVLNAAVPAQCLSLCVSSVGNLCTYRYMQSTIPRLQNDKCEQGKSEGFDSCDRPSNFTQIGFKSSIFQPVWP